MNISFVHTLSWPTLFLILGTGILFLGYVYHRFSVPAQFKIRTFLFLIRFAVLLVIFFIILDPYWRNPGGNEWLGVLVDTSQSMLVREPGEKAEFTRMDWVNDFLKNDRVWQELKKNKLRQILTFDSETRKADMTKPFQASGSSSRLLHAVREINRIYHKDPDLLGVILLSDGAATDNESEREEINEELLFPWISVGIGNETKVPNLRILPPEVPEQAFVGEIVPVKILWEASGMPEVKILIHVLLDNQLIAKKEITSKELSTEVELSMKSPGEHSLDIRIEPVPGEGSLEDNSVRVWFEVVPRSIRVFYAESFYKDKNFFKDALEEDADFSVTFVSSLIGFAKKFHVPFIKNSIHGFPGSREELLQYDVVVLSDVKRNLLEPVQIEWIRELVQKEGGALIMVGGMDSFGDGGYVGSPIETMLPVEISEEYKKEMFLSAKGTSENAFTPVIPENAGTHPVLRLVDDEEENGKLWKSVPQLGGYNYVGRLKPGGVLLLKHPVDTSAFGPRVVMAVHNFGKGRVMAFTSDITPNWGQWFQDWRGKEQGWLYARFWRNAVKWLSENRIRRRASPLEIKREPSLAEAGEPVRFTVSLPSEAGEIRNELLSLEILQKEKIILQKKFPDLTSQQTVSWEINSLDPGNYTFEAALFRQNASPLEVKSSFAMHASRLESRNLASRHATLRAIARKSKGVFLPFSRRSELEQAIEKIRKTRLRQQSVPFWNQPWLYFFILVFLAVDWLIRKKKGLE